MYLLLTLLLAACSPARPTIITGLPLPAQSPSFPSSRCLISTRLTTPTVTPSPTITLTPISTATPTPLPPVRFAVIGDYGLAGDAEAAVAALVHSWQPDFILTVGDNNYPSGATDTMDENVGQYFQAYIYPYYGQYGPGADTNRFFPTLGNHDWTTTRPKPISIISPCLATSATMISLGDRCISLRLIRTIVSQMA